MSDWEQHFLKTHKNTNVAYLDPSRCTPTDDPEYPLIYETPKGIKVRIHRSRIVNQGDSYNPPKQGVDVV